MKKLKMHHAPRPRGTFDLDTSRAEKHVFGMKFMLLILLLSSFAVAEDVKKFETLTTVDGKIYKGVIVTKVLPDGITIRHESGARLIPFEKLPLVIQNQLGGFDPEKAKMARNERDIGDAKIMAVLDKETAEKLAKANSTIGKTREQCVEKYDR